MTLVVMATKFETKLVITETRKYRRDPCAYQGIWGQTMEWCQSNYDDWAWLPWQRNL